jgi:hypothetical protein
MAAVEPIGDDEVILRRIPPSELQPGLKMDSTSPRPQGGLRANSVRLRTKDGETGLSCTCMRLTSPRVHLDDLIHDDIDPTGWMVCRICVRDVRRLGLEVIHKPTERDPGHCEIVGKSEQGATLNYPNIKSSKLAKETRILTDEEVAKLKAGDLPTE